MASRLLHGAARLLHASIKKNGFSTFNHDASAREQQHEIHRRSADDEGTMFIAWSPNANFAVSGRRGRDGELYVGSIYQDASMSTLKGVKHSIEQIKNTGVDVELVTGAEADKLFTEMALRLQMSGKQEEKPN